jgi:hypothetical protein
MKGNFGMIHESTMIPANTYHAGSGDEKGWSGMWVFALVIIFFALIFWARRDDRGNGLGEYAPLLMGMGGYAGGRDKNLSHEIWDVERDQMREFANIRQQISETGYRGDMANAKYFYEQQKTNLLGFKDVEIQGLQNKGEIIGRIDGLERRMDQDIIRSQGNELNYLKTILGVRGWGIPPAQPVSTTPFPYPCHAEHAFV